MTANWKTPGATVVDLPEGDRLAWLKERRNGVGGTDAAALMGVHTTNEIASAKTITAAEVFLEKTSPDEPVEEDKSIFALGHLLEPGLLKRAEEAFGIKTRPAPFFRAKDEPFRYANPDALADDGGIVECKTASNRGKAAPKWQAGDVTAHAYVQTQHYLAVTGRTHSYYAVGIRDDYSGWEKVPRDLWGEDWFAELAIREFIMAGPVERNEAVIEELLAVEREFWQAVQSGVMPDHIAAQLSPADLYRETIADREVEPAIPEMFADDLTRLDVIKADQKRLGAERAVIEDRIKGEIGSGEYLVLGGVRRARWHTVPQSSFDAKTFRADHPELAEEYTRRSTTRRLDVKGAK